MRMLSPSIVKPTRYTDAPDHLRMWQCDVYGPQAIATAVCEATEAHNRGEPHNITLIVATHPAEDDGGEVRHCIRVGIGRVEGAYCWRYVGEGDSPNGPGSSSVIASWYGKQAMDPAHVSAVLAERAARLGPCVFVGKD